MPIEVSVYSALASEADEAPPAPHISTPRMARPPLRLADAKPNRSTNIGSPSLTAQPPPVNVEAAPSSLEPVTAHFSLGSVLTRAVVAASGSSEAATRAAGYAPTEGPVAPLSESAVSTRAQLQFGLPPSYTAAAEAAGIEAELPFEIVVDCSGSVQSARPLARVGYGLDEAAALAIRNYRFSPAQQAHRPVRVRMRWVMRFRLR
jgi:TonB family protein